MDASSPLTLLIEAAETGDQKKIKENSDRFSKHARKLTEVVFELPHCILIVL